MHVLTKLHTKSNATKLGSPKDCLASNSCDEKNGLNLTKTQTMTVRIVVKTIYSCKTKQFTLNVPLLISFPLNQ